MGMAVNQLFADAVADIGEGETACFFLHPGVEYHLEQDIPQLLLQKGRILPVNGLHRFVGLLDEIVPDAVVVLFPVPDTASFAPEKFHDPQQIVHLVVVLDRKVYHLAPPKPAIPEERPFDAFPILTDKTSLFKPFFDFFMVWQHFKVTFLQCPGEKKGSQVDSSPQSDGR